MFYGIVIGNVVSSKKLEKLNGSKLLLVEVVNYMKESMGKIIVAVDYVQAGEGDFVFLSKSKDSAFPMEDRNTPVDAGIMGIIDRVVKYS